MNTNANSLDWSGQRFSKSEFPEGVIHQLSSKVIGALFNIRNNLPPTHVLHPSPLYGAHVRKSQTSGSRHNIIDIENGGTRLSDAVDFFCKREHASDVWFECIKHPSVNGIGIYRNSLYRGSTTDWTMLHVDTRPSSQKAMWAADRNWSDDPFQYFSINQNPQKFFEIIAKDGIWF